jgi:hypothetical protein
MRLNPIYRLSQSQSNRERLLKAITGQSAPVTPSEEYQVVIANISNHLNDEVVELLPPQSRAPP